METYTVSLTTKLKAPQSGLIAIEPEDYTETEIEALKGSGARVLAYLSVGSVSDERPYYKLLQPYQLKRLKDWPHEHYLDLRQPEVREWLRDRAKALKDMGFDGWWLDNVDVYEEYRSTKMFHAMTSTLQDIKAVGGYVMINGGIEYLTDLLMPHKTQLGIYEDRADARKTAAAVKKTGFSAAIIKMDDLLKVQAGSFSVQSDADELAEKLRAAGFDLAGRITLFNGRASYFIDGVTQEEVFSLITDYRGKGKFGTQEKEESERYQAHMRRVREAGMDAFFLEYTRSKALRGRIEAFCEDADMTGCCISGDVDL